MITPLHRPTKLAGNPKRTPKYSVSASLKNGAEIQVADPTATRAMIALMDMQAVMGGAASHFGGPSAFAELMSALFGVVFHHSEDQEWYEKFHILNDAGHCENGLYALKANYGFADLSLAALKGFRSIHSQLTGHGESHLFPEAVYLSNGPLGSCFPQTQGLAFADRLAGHKQVTVTAISDGGCMEGEAREALAAIPGLALKQKMNPYVLIISDNNTKLSGRIDKDSFSMNPTFLSLKDFGWKLISLENGHDLQKCVWTIEEAIESAIKNPAQPVAIHAKTVKGFGTLKTVQSSSGGHGFPLSDPQELPTFLEEIYNGAKIPQEFLDWAKNLIDEKMQKLSKVDESSSVPTEKVQVGISKAMIKKKKAGLPIVSISSDLQGSTGVAGFQKEFPESSQDVGVAESNMISMAAGLSKQGFIPVVDTFAQFGVTKGALPLTMASLSQAPVIAVFSHVGFQDAADGASHQALTYFSMVSSIPYTDVYALTSSSEAEALFSLALEEFSSAYKSGEVPHSKIFFLGRENFPKSYLPNDFAYKLGQSQVVFDNTDLFKNSVTIVAAGALLPQAIEAAYLLEKEGRGTCVVNPSIINRPDLQTIRTCLQKTSGRLLTVEDHQLIGGMGAMLAHSLLQAGIACQVKSLGVDGQFGRSAYSAIELYQTHELDAKSIANKSKEF